MNKRQYHCHDCGHNFEREADAAPHCPECDSGSVTFEGRVKPSLPSRLWNGISSLFNYFFRPWLFFQERGISRSVGIFLVMVLFVGMFVAGYQAHLANDTVESIGSPGSFYVLRDPGVLLEELSGVASASDSTVETSTTGESPPVTLGQIGLVYGLGLGMEFYWAGILLIIIGWDKFRAAKAQLGAVMAGSVWIPNLLLAMVQIVYFRSLQYGYFQAMDSVSLTFQIAHLIVSGWLIYILLGGLYSLDIRFSQWLTRVGVMTFLQVFGMFMILDVMKSFIFPRMALPAGGTGLMFLKQALRFSVWPFSALFV